MKIIQDDYNINVTNANFKEKIERINRINNEISDKANKIMKILNAYGYQQNKIEKENEDENESDDDTKIIKRNVHSKIFFEEDERRDGPGINMDKNRDIEKRKVEYDRIHKYSKDIKILTSEIQYELREKANEYSKFLNILNNNLF
jgi:hypothetical protein